MVATKRVLYLLVDPCAFIRMSNITRLGIINLWSIVLISIAVISKTFWEIKDEKSFSNVKVYFSGVGDFEIDNIDRGIHIDWLEGTEVHGMCKEV